MTVCIHCEYNWEYSGDLNRATCPSCGRKTPVEGDIRTDGGARTPTTLGYRVLYVLAGHARGPEALLSELEATFDATPAPQAVHRTVHALKQDSLVRESDDGETYVIESAGRRTVAEELTGVLKHISIADLKRTAALADVDLDEHRLANAEPARQRPADMPFKAATQEGDEDD